jgi:predicted nucleic acid-binding protein
MSPPTISNKKYFVLDSCVVDYMVDPYLGELITQQINEWAGKTWGLSISGISYAELLNGAYKNKQKSVNELLKTFTCFNVSEKVASSCGVLGNIYKAHNSEIKDVGIADRVIATTSLLYNLPLITGNVKDFPYPFFNEITSSDILYKINKNTRCQSVAVLKPNVAMARHWWSKSK